MSELEPKGLHPIVDYNTVEQMVGLVVCTNHLYHFSYTDEWVDQGSHHRVQYTIVASLIHLYVQYPRVYG